MARPGINYVDVSKAAQTITDQGKNPTVDRVLAHLGTGSKSTIAPLLKEWKANQEEQNQLNTEGLPPELIIALKQVYERVQNQADLKIVDIMDASEQALKSVKDELSQVKASIVTLTETNQDLEKALKEAISDNTELKQHLTDNKETIIRQQSELENKEQRITDYKNSLKEQKKEVANIREHLEHYQAEIAEERQRERQQHQARIQQLEQTLADYLDRNQRLQSEIDQHLIDLTSKNKALSDLQEANQALSNQQQADKQKIISLEEKLDTQTQRATDQKAKLTRVNEQLSSAEKSSAILESLVNTLQVQHDKLEVKVEQLSDKNSELSQEKAMLQGQLKQLQKSL